MMKQTEKTIKMMKNWKTTMKNDETQRNTNEKL